MLCIPTSVLPGPRIQFVFQGPAARSTSAALVLPGFLALEAFAMRFMLSLRCTGTMPTAESDDEGFGYPRFAYDHFLRQFETV